MTISLVFVDNNSVRIGTILFILNLTLISTFKPIPAQADGDSFDSARQRLSDAQAEFYKASKQPNLSPADLKRVRDQTLGPAQESLQRAIQQEKETTLRKYTRPVGAPPKAEKGRVNSSKKDGGQSSTPGLQLDGRGIQRELEFKPRTAPSGRR